MAETIFTKIMSGEIPAEIVYQDDHVAAFRDINPQAPQHLLVVPRAVIPTLNDVTPENSASVAQIFEALPKIAEQLGFKESGYRAVFNCGPDAHQEVLHIHLHVLAGRDMTWPPG